MITVHKINYALNGTTLGTVSEPLDFPLKEMLCFKPSYWRGVGLYDFISWINDEEFLVRKGNTLFIYNVSGVIETYPIEIDGLAFKGVGNAGSNWVFEKEGTNSQIKELQVLNENAEVEWEYAFESFDNVLLSSEVHVDTINNGALIELLFKRNIEGSTKQKATSEFYWLPFDTYELKKLYSSAEYDASITAATNPTGVIESIPGVIVLSKWSNEFPFKPFSSMYSGYKDMIRFVLE